MKQVLSVQDLSCLGKCSLTVAMPVLSAMGCSCTPLPTAILSSHTAFPNPHVRALTQDIPEICRHWQSVGASFDAVCVGYLSDSAQVAAVEGVLKAFGAAAVIDPAMADHGKLYSGLDSHHVEAMKQLCRSATVLLPNVTEAALLTDTPYEAVRSHKDCELLLEKLGVFGAEAVILTGVSAREGKTGYMGTDKQGNRFCYQTETLPSCHGTGDLFAAVFTGAYVQGRDVQDCARLAAQFVEKALLATKNVSSFGLSFESQLPWLWEQL